MNRLHENKWTSQHAIETNATPQAIWRLFLDVPRWRTWNAGIERIELDGPFAEGTWFTMQPPGQTPLRSQLIEVNENRGFVDETRVGDLIVRVAHCIDPIDTKRTRVTYAIEASGPDAAEVGPAIAADFPDVLAALAAVAEAT